MIQLTNSRGGQPVDFDWIWRHRYSRQGYRARTALSRSFVSTAFFSVLKLRLPSNAAITQVFENWISTEGLARKYLKINGRWQDHMLYAAIDDNQRS